MGIVSDQAINRRAFAPSPAMTAALTAHELAPSSGRAVVAASARADTIRIIALDHSRTDTDEVGAQLHEAWTQGK